MIPSVYRPTNAELIERLSISPPLAVPGRPGVFSVKFTPKWGLIPVRAPNERPERVEFPPVASGEVWVDATTGAVIRHIPLVAKASPLTAEDYEAKAIELVLTRDRANDGLSEPEIKRRSGGRRAC